MVVGIDWASQSHQVCRGPWHDPRTEIPPRTWSAVTHVLGDEAVELGDHFGDGAVIRGDYLAQILGIEPRRQCGRADQVAESPSAAGVRPRVVPVRRAVPPLSRQRAPRRRARQSHRAARGDGLQVPRRDL
jgi:hypothetical protein